MNLLEKQDKLPMHAVLKLHTIRAFTHIGYYEPERITGQWIELGVDLTMADAERCASDAIEDTIDYGYITGRLKKFLEASEAKLIEKLALDVRDEVFRLDVHKKINHVVIRIKKTSPSDQYDGHAVYELAADRVV